MTPDNWMHTIRRPPALGPAPAVLMAWRRAAQLAGRALEGLLVWSDRSRQRRQLAELDDHMLRDIGLSRADVMAETTKPFWRP